MEIQFRLLEYSQVGPWLQLDRMEKFDVCCKLMTQRARGLHDSTSFQRQTVTLTPEQQN
jgi:hypothetical protein